MRKIESNMVTAIRKNKNFTSGNTSTQYFNISRKTLIGGSTQVRLHGNLIAIIHDTQRKLDDGYWEMRNDIELSSCGWETVTTKSRLNALLAYTPFKIVQKNFQWFVYSNITEQTMPFYDGMKLPY